ncbi:myotubularin-related protein 14 isoform X2 [Condylostylus longicornis]|uniref:myotubularin-related protein 14 isoform X2 n=1 Tax=Condylostylus longicornis TaxID=2530218 RepID=UPI00244DB8E4|nr:myotubularin-related protein 14 isoform X2 [Condylostylus longicornis]
MECNVTQEDLQILLEKFEKKSYEAGLCEKGSFEYETTKKLENLLKLDYKIIELDNINGALNSRYPCKIFIPEYERQRSINGFNVLPNTDLNNTPTTNSTTLNNCVSGRAQNVIYEDLNDTGKTREMITMAKYARCRQRFVVPVIYFKGNYICRSSTLSVMPETYGRKVVDYAHNCIYGGKNSQIQQMDQDDNSTTDDIPFDSLYNPEPSPFSYEVVIKSDIQLLKSLNVNTIIDLMVEQRKIKYFVAVSSSEKADPENHYKNFNILSLPYPGCEFFSKFRDNNYMAKNLYFNWKQNFIDASLNIPRTGPAFDIDLNWQDYRKWDLVLITQNYLKASLKYIQEENSGILVHCISGWDRTPLFISLLRLSLWADGLIHDSMTPLQMAYFTLAYDWYQFGHQLPDRLTRGEEIMFFCFHVLKYITDEEFSILEQRKRTKTTSSSGSSSVIILKSDCCDDDSLKEDFFQNLDQDSNDSFANCDMSSTTNENYFSSNNITNRSPNPKRSKTSPISVPEVSACQRQRQESTSSNGSWQVVTETGSIDSIRNGSYMMRFIQQDQQSNCSNSNHKETKSFSSLRKQRLSAVRACFIQAYGKTIGLKFKEGTSMNLATFIGTIADQLF